MNRHYKSSLIFAWLYAMTFLCGIGLAPMIASAGNWQVGPSLQTARDEFAGDARFRFNNVYDIAHPTVAITAPTAGQRIVTNTAFTVRGTAADNVGVASVWVKLNGNDWTQATGTTSWNLPLQLTPGPDTVHVYSQDAVGNRSATSSVVCTYVVMGNLTVTTNGAGTWARTPSGAPEVGQRYTLTAMPASGFVFVNWTDGNGNVVTNKPALTFTMASNLTFTANFVDSKHPTMTIAAPTAGQRIVTTGLFTVRGTASDNVEVTAVWVQLNNNDWTQATGTTSWNLPLQLTPGPETVRVYSQDAMGNRSATSSVACTFVVMGNLTVTTNGAGTYARTPSGAPEVGQRYTLTATPASGFGFVNWTDGNGNVVTNKPALTFTMASNLTFTANFVDTKHPTVTIAAPTAGQRIVTNGLFTVRGTAADNVGVTAVWVQLNNNDWTQATGTTSWNLPLQLTPGPDTVRVYSQDAMGNRSATSSVTCTYVVMGNLMVTTNGAGTYARTPSGAPEVGQRYTLTATPASGFRFVNWTDGNGNVVTNKPALTFTMASNLTFRANFTATKPPATPAGMVLIPAGVNSGTDPDFGTYSLTQPASLYMDSTLVTKAQWDDVYTWALAHGYTFENWGCGKAANHPVQMVNWHDCAKWCNARSEKEGRPACYRVAGDVYSGADDNSVTCSVNVAGYRLPTAVEWEYAARGGFSGRRFPWGNTIDHTVANYYSYPFRYTYDIGYSGYDARYCTGGLTPYTSPVGSFPANGYGLHDMTGNVWEWCSDWYPGLEGSARVDRGGGWASDAPLCRSAYLNPAAPDGAHPGIGFRAVLSPGH